MTDFLPDDIVEGLAVARKSELQRKSRLRIKVGGQVFPVLRFWSDGFALDASAAPQLRGRVDVFSGARHLYQCLVVASAEEAGEMVYEFKRNTVAVDSVPLDFARDENAPAALIAYDES